MTAPFVTRKAIMNALLACLQTMPSIKVWSRRYQMFTDLSMSAQMPYGMLCKPRENYAQKQAIKLPSKRLLSCEAIVYIAAGQDQAPAVIPDDTVEDIMDEFDTALRPPIGSEVLTLGGLVDHCYIEGDVICVPGDIDGLGLIHVPINILIP